LARDELRVDDGDVRIGYKLGWTSAAMRAALGIDRPNWGTLWRSQRIDDHLDLTTLRHAKVEPEIVYVAGSELRGSKVNQADVVANAAGWAIGIEVVHPRWASFDFTWLDNTADNSSAAAVAVGPTRRLDVDPSRVDVRFSNGTETRSGLGENAMGSPAEAVAWLVQQLIHEGRWIEAGDLVFTGGLTAPFDVTRGSRYEAACAELGTVEITTGRRG
jgi:2-keto-4-pentenoate hydratase